jgi:hypothetical protein
MIKNQDRSKWFGASDTSMIMGNWETETFKNWWLVKLGINPNNGVKTWVMDCGNIMEIPIIRFIEKMENRKIQIGRFPFYKIRLRLRCNYDGLRKSEVVEIKTTGKGFTKVPKNYWQQCQVLMWRKKKQRTGLYEYRMTINDYANPYFPQIDKTRLFRHEIRFDEGFIKNEYLPRLRYLARCLKAKKFPKAEEYVQNNDKK